MNRTELVAALADRAATDKKTADALLTALVDTVTENVTRGDAVTIPGFVKFEQGHRNARTARNPQTGATVKVKAAKVPKMKALTAFKEAVKSGKVPKKAAPATKAAAKKAPAKKAPAKKAVAKKAPAKKAPAKKR